MSKRILFVAPSGSIHTRRWMQQISEQGWKLYLFPSHDTLWIDPDFHTPVYCVPFFFLYRLLHRAGMQRLFGVMYRAYQILLQKMNPDYYDRRLARYINRIRPDLIHSLETQGSGYLVSRVRKKYFTSKKFPVWWHTNWGSDIALFGRIREHKPLIREVLENCNYYSCECERDVQLAKDFGFSGITFPVYPNTGGFDPYLLDAIAAEAAPPSKRRIIMLKGYQGWAGRALNGMRALARCSDLLKGYEIVVYTNTAAEDIRIAAALLSADTGIPVRLLPGNSAHADILRSHSQARISIGLSMGDGISTSLLEAMAMGSFPVQSYTACTAGWMEDGVTGMLVAPEDTDQIEQALRKVLQDDELVDHAAHINRNTIREKADFTKLKQLTIQSYQNIFNNAPHE
jgi:hypothetical protein